MWENCSWPGTHVYVPDHYPYDRVCRDIDRDSSRLVLRHPRDSDAIHSWPLDLSVEEFSWLQQVAAGTSLAQIAANHHMSERHLYRQLQVCGADGGTINSRAGRTYSRHAANLVEATRGTHADPTSVAQVPTAGSRATDFLQAQSTVATLERSRQ